MRTKKQESVVWVSSELLKLKRAAKLCGVSKQRFNIYANEGRIPYELVDGIRRYTKADVLMLVSKRKQWIRGRHRTEVDKRNQ